MTCKIVNISILIWGCSRIYPKCLAAQYCLDAVLFLFIYLFSTSIFSSVPTVSLGDWFFQNHKQQQDGGVPVQDFFLCVNRKDTLVRLPRLPWTFPVLNQIWTGVTAVLFLQSAPGANQPVRAPGQTLPLIPDGWKSKVLFHSPSLVTDFVLEGRYCFCTTGL